MNKKIISVILSLLLLFIFTFSVYAYDPYGSVTEDTSQVKILVAMMINDPAFDMFSDWFCYRHSEYDYRLYYNFDPEEHTANLLRYYSNSSGYNITWNFSRTEEENVYIPNTEHYTIVGSFLPALGCKTVREYHYSYIIYICVILFTIVFCFYVFRLKRRYL